MTCSLYRHYSKDFDLLYVGVALSTLARLSQHRAHSIWFHQIHRVEIEHYNNREEALAAETLAIKKEKPKYNLAQTDKMPSYLDRKYGKFMQQTKEALAQRILDIKPINSLYDAAQLLMTPQTIVQKLIKEGKLGHVVLPSTKRTSSPIAITGWQLLEYIEFLHEEYQNKVPPFVLFEARENK